jgi:HSP20 family protein
MTTWKDSLRGIAPWKWNSSRGSEVVPARAQGEDLHPFNFLQRQMNSLFEDFFSGFGNEGASFIPKVSVSEDSEKIYVTAELPGMEQRDVELTLTNEVLTLRGEKKVEQERKDGNTFLAMERSYGFFQRSIPISCEIDTDKVDAVFKNGVLSVTLAKTPAARANTKTIPIRS